MTYDECTTSKFGRRSQKPVEILQNCKYVAYSGKLDYQQPSLHKFGNRHSSLNEKMRFAEQYLS